jgi:hypothetical protein
VSHASVVPTGVPQPQRKTCGSYWQIVGEVAVRTLAQSVYVDSTFGVECELPRAGSALENPFVYDASARELKAMAERGLIEVIKEQSHALGDEQLIDHLSFRRLR